MLVQSGIATEDKVATAATSGLQDLYFDAARRSHVDLIIGSQLAIPKVVQALPPAYLADLGELLHGRRADMLLGVYFPGADSKRPFNGVLSIGHSGLQRYLKQNLFPWGEYLPDWEWLQAMLPRPGLGMSRAPEGQGALVSGVHRLAIAICFEAAFGDTWSRQAATADVLVNVSSDSAVKSGQLARQFQRIVQTRAMELQKPLVRTSDIRGSYFVDPFGRLGATAPAGEYSEVQQRISGRHGLTPYARWGDAFVLALAVSVMGIALYLVLRRSDLTAALVGVALTGAAPQRQLGQVLPAGMALLLIIGGTFYLMVNAGQSISEKIRVTNAADAAAYSAGLVEARALNYDAYINRAMVANQIAMAQMLSFTSWVNYAAKATENYPNAETEVNEFLLPNPDVAVLDAAFFGGGIAASFSGTSPAEFAQRVNSVVGAFITASDLAVQMMALTQPLVQLNLTAGIRQQQIAESVVKAMDSKLTAEVVLVSHGFDTFTKGYAKGGAGGDLRGRFADVTVRSRDAFTRERNWTVDSFDIPLVRQNGALKKRGGTDLIGYDEWRAVDTLELHGQRFGCGKWGLSWCDDIQRPVGWGSSEVDAGTGDAGQGTHGNAYGENRRTAGRADAAMSAPDSARYHGIPNSWDLSDVDTKTEPSTAITVRVSKAHGDTLTSGNAAKAKAAGKLAVFGDHPAGGQLAALSRAQVYFDRISPRKDGRTELGSLYNPYWRVRLVAPTAADKLYAATQQGNLALP
jgi:predicted amidohydrolase